MDGEGQEHSQKNEHTVTLRVEHARLEPGHKIPEFTFQEQTKVGEAAKEAAVKLGYAAGDTYTFSHEKITWDRERTLESYHPHNEELVVLVDIGKAV